MTRLPEKRIPAAASTVPRGAIRKMLPGGASDRLQGRDTRAGHSPQRLRSCTNARLPSETQTSVLREIRNH
jgi:hypothetical protein